MKAEQLIQRIGNVDECLIVEADRQPNRKKGKGCGALRKVLAFAVAAALMAGSFSAGAMVTKGGEKTIIKEKIVVKEPETVEVGDTGISLILPESWAGKYGVRTENLKYDHIIEVYHLGVWEKYGKQNVEEYGDSLDIEVLFSVSAREGELPMDYNFGYWARILAVKDGVSYVLSRPGGTIGATDDEALLEWLAMREELPQIKILLSDWLKENSYNSTNWKEGTVTVSLFDKNEFTKQFFCDEEHSKAIRELLIAQEYTSDLELGYHYTDARIAFSADVFNQGFPNKVKYLVNFETGIVELFYDACAQLSDEDLAKLKALLEEAENTSISQPGS